MSKIALKGNPINTSGQLPPIHSQAPDFAVTKVDLTETGLQDYRGKKVVLNVFPSVDTPTCALSVRRFNEAATQLTNAVILCISADLPFAQKRFCGAENITQVIPTSVFRNKEFGEHYGLTIIDGPLKGLLSRAIIIIDENGKILYTEQVAEIADEPNYQAALAALREPR